MIAALLALFSAIPGVATAISFVFGKKYDAQVAIVQAKTGVNIEKAKQIVSAAATEDHERSTRLATIASNTLMTFLVVGFATPFVIFIWKVVVVDIVVGPGCIWFTKMCWVANTDPIRGQVADWGNTIIAALFGSTAAVTIGKMILSKKSDD